MESIHKPDKKVCHQKDDAYWLYILGKGVKSQSTAWFIKVINKIWELPIWKFRYFTRREGNVFWCGSLAACREIDGDANRGPMWAARRGSFFLGRLVEGVVNTSMPGAAGLVRACSLPRWHQARDGHRALLGGAKARGGRAIFWG